MEDNKNKIDILFGLAASDSHAELEQILEKDPNKATLVNEQGIRLLMWAMYHKQPGSAAVIYRYLLKPEPGEVVALNDLYKLTQLLESTPGLISEYSSDGFTLLHYACFFGHLECSQFLIEREADVNAIASNPSKVFPLHSAAAAQALGVVKLLLDFGAEVNAQQNGGFTALMTAAMHNNDKMIDILLSHSADVGVKDDSAKTAYDHGLENGHDIASIKP